MWIVQWILMLVQPIDRDGHASYAQPSKKNLCLPVKKIKKEELFFPGIFNYFLRLVVCPSGKPRFSKNLNRVDSNAQLTTT